jgi:parvulin-like peptidyl-prolyl isomerase
MSDQIRVSHILLMYEGSAHSSATRGKQEAATEIAGLRQQVEDGADFGAVARDNSDCPSSAQGGDLGTFSRGQMVPEFETAAFGLAVGDLSDVVETAFGYHIIQRTG